MDNIISVRVSSISVNPFLDNWLNGFTLIFVMCRFFMYLSGSKNMSIENQISMK